MQTAAFHNRKTIFFKKGFFLIEVVVATAVIATVLVALLGAITKSVQVSALALQKTQAAYLLDEGAEAVKFLRNGSWDSIANLEDGAQYYLLWNGNAWTLTQTPQSVDSFARSITVASVYRDVTGDIVETGGTLDAGTRKVLISVSWQSAAGAVTETLPLYIADIAA
jgi:Tfp pilus assembly protein PilV